MAARLEGHAEAGRISGERLRAILESARGIRPDDNSDAAKEARRIASYGDLDGLCFVCRIGVEPAQNGYKAKNRLDYVITPDQTAWHPVTQDPRPAASPAAAASTSAPAKIERPIMGGADADKKTIGCSGRLLPPSPRHAASCLATTPQST